MTHVNVPLPDEVLETLHRSLEEVEADVRLAAALDCYRRGMISQGRAAEVAGVTRADFIDALAVRQIPVVQTDLDDLDRERGDA